MIAVPLLLNIDSNEYSLEICPSQGTDAYPCSSTIRVLVLVLHDDIYGCSQTTAYTGKVALRVLVGDYGIVAIGYCSRALLVRVLYCTVLYSTVLYSTVQYSTVP